jgi:hypothetical protein
MKFLGKIDGPTIEEYITYWKKRCSYVWILCLSTYLVDTTAIWCESLNHDKLKTLSNDEFEQVFLDKWSHAKKKDIESHKGLFSCGNILFQVHGCIQKKKVIVSINHSCKHNFINVNLTKILQILEKHIQGTQVDGENVQVFKDLKVIMDKYVLHSNFCVVDMDGVDVVLGYP